MGNAAGSGGHSQIAGRLAPALFGFEHINRYWDGTHNTVAAKILPGEYYVTTRDEAIVTVLGSCVSACIRDCIFGIGGMNHFMLPAQGKLSSDSWGSGGLSAATRYGNFAMEHLINEVLKAGGQRKHLEVKIFGGGKILAQMTDIGARNIAFVREYIRMEGFRLTAADLGDVFPRKVMYYPASGRVRVRKLRALHNNTVAEREVAYISQLERQPVEGDIELF